MAPPLLLKLPKDLRATMRSYLSRKDDAILRQVHSTLRHDPVYDLERFSFKFNQDNTQVDAQVAINAARIRYPALTTMTLYRELKKIMGQGINQTIKIDQRIGLTFSVEIPATRLKFPHKIENLTLSDIQVFKGEGEYLKLPPNLTVLKLCICNLNGVHGVQQFLIDQQQGRKSKLKQLQVSNCHMGDEGCALLFQYFLAGGCSELTHLTITSNMFGDLTRESLQGLANLHQLKSLTIARCKITNLETVEAVANNLPPALTHLKFENAKKLSTMLFDRNPITGGVIPTFASTLHQKRLDS